MGDYANDGGLGAADNSPDEEDRKKDEEAPKPTADVMMSRNLKGGAAKNFNFAFSSDGEDDKS